MKLLKNIFILVAVTSSIYGCVSHVDPTAETAATIDFSLDKSYESRDSLIKDVSNDEQIYPVYFGTTRRFDERRIFTSERTKKIQYGVANVHVPLRRKRGSSGTFWGDVMGNNKRIKIIGDYVLYEDYKDFNNIVFSSLSKEKRDNFVVIFIHGFNNSFDEAVIRSAQLAADTWVPKNHMFLFSWPAVKRMRTYTQDEASVEVNEKHFSEFISKVSQSVGDKKIHIVAHSMGNRALLRVIDRGIAHAKNKKLKLGQIILAAADVDAELFSQFADSYIAASDKTTVYLSPYDKAVRLSQLIHKYPRLGCGVAPHSPNADIDYVLSTIPSEFPAHAYIVEHGPILDDLQSMFWSGKSYRPIATGDWERKSDNFWVVGGAIDGNEARCAGLEY